MWSRIRAEEYDLRHVGKWETYDGFLGWMFAQGWQMESMIMRKDAKKPKTPANCYITTKGTRKTRSWAWEQEFSRRWAKTVNPFRKAAGLDPL